MNHTRTGNGQLTRNFHISEFKCKNGEEVPPHLIPNVLELAEQLQVIRDYLGEPIHLNSAYRTPAYNKKIGGAPRSQHLLAKAADCTVRSKTPKQFAAIVEKLIKEGKVKIGGIGIYKGFTHLDTREGKSRWTL